MDHAFVDRPDDPVSRGHSPSAAAVHASLPGRAERLHSGTEPSSKERMKTGSVSSAQPSAEVALMLILALCTFSAAWVRIPLLSTAALEVFGFFSLLGFVGRRFGFYRPLREPRVALWQPASLAAALGLAAWAYSLPIAQAWTTALALVPSVLLFWLWCGPWHCLQLPDRSEHVRRFEQNERKEENE